MFWTEHIRQLHLFDDDYDDVEMRGNVSRLIAFAERAFPSQDANFHRYFAFLEHDATHRFLKAMLSGRFGHIDAAKEPTLDWLMEVGSFETCARTTRNGCVKGQPSPLIKRRVPEWYDRYCLTARFEEMKGRACDQWAGVMTELSCSMNARHPFEVMHHRDYGRLGEADEFRYLVPLCNECHAFIRVRGPAVPAAPVEGVKKWLT